MIFKKTYLIFKSWIQNTWSNKMQGKIEVQTEVQRVEERLKKLFKINEPFVIALNGEWGVGKTHFWNSFIKTNLHTQLDNKEIAYVSLFGKDTLSDIESDIIMQVSRTAKIKNVLNNTVGSIGYAGVKVSNVLSLIPKSDFKDIVICFDDFERKSGKLDSKDILGLISQFKEQKSCKILMIYNQEEIKDKEVLSDYKDKVIDYELHYKPTVEESFKIVSSRLKAFNDYPLEYLKRKGINNIRVIKRLINSLNDFEFILEEIKDHQDIKKELVYAIIRLSILNAKFSNFDLESLVKYVNDKRKSDNGETYINNEYETMLFLLDIQDRYFFPSDILRNIYYYIKNSIIDTEQLLSIINQKKILKSRGEISQKIIQTNLKYNYDLSYNREDFASELFNALKEGENYIVDITSVEDFIYYIEELIEITGNQSYKEYAIEKLQNYIDHMYEGDNIHEFTAFGRKHKVVEFDSSLEEYINEKESNIKTLQTQSQKEIIDIFNAPRINQSWGNEPDLLASVEKDTYKKYMEESAEFMEETLSFIGWTQGFSNGSGFENAVNIIIEAIFELKDTPNYEFQINKIINRLNLPNPIQNNEEEHENS